MSDKIMSYLNGYEIYDECGRMMIEQTQSDVYTVGNSLNSTNDAVKKNQDAISAARNEIISVGNRVKALEDAPLSNDNVMKVANEALSTAKLAKSDIDAHMRTVGEASSTVRVDNGRLEIENANVNQTLSFGDWMISRHHSGNLSLKWIGGSA